jgi:ATP-binding cassette subfamily C protein
MHAVGACFASPAEREGVQGPIEMSANRNNALGVLLAPVRPHLTLAMVFSIAINLLYLTPTLYMLQIYDRVLAAGSLATLAFVSLALGICILCLSAFEALRGRVLARAAVRLEDAFGPSLANAAFAKPVATSASQPLRDFDFVRATFAGPTAANALDLPWTPVFLVAVTLLHPLLGVLAGCGCLLLVAAALVTERVGAASHDKANETNARLYAAQEGLAVHGEAYRALGMRPFLMRRLTTDRARIANLQAAAGLGHADAIGLMRGLRLALQSAMLGVGAWLALRQEISLGAVMAGSILAARAFSPIDQVVASWRQWRGAFIALAAIKHTLCSPRETAKMALPTPQGALELEAVGALRPGTEEWALQDLSLQFRAGEVIGVMGASGAGKTTLARILSGALKPDQGRLRLDGADVADWDPDALGKSIGYLPQEIALAEGTIAENIARFDCEEAETDSAGFARKVIAAAQAAGAHAFIQSLPGGYNARLGPMGRGLSHGQAQRVALARALFGDPSVLILDEPNAHLDPDGEAALVRAVQMAAKRGALTVIIAHRLQALNIADRVLVLANGRLACFGPRAKVAAWLAERPTQINAARMRALNETA